jgi:hypothetical protein
MSAMIEVYYSPPLDPGREQTVQKHLATRGGKVTHREEEPARITLTIEFEKRADAEIAARDLLATGLHVEGPSDY